jgi:PAS domain S-box-containing protein
MQFQNSPYIFPLLVSALISAALAVYAWRRRDLAPAAPSFALFMLLAAWWALATAIGRATAWPPAQLYWLRITYLAIVFVPVAWLRFAVQYTGNERWLTSRREALIVLLPVVTVVMLWSNEQHYLMFTEIEQATSNGFTFLRAHRGPWFWVHTAYSYLLLLAGTVLIFQALARSPRSYRGQAGGLLWGVLAPWLINGLSLAGIVQMPDIDLTPFTFTFSGAAFAWALFRYKLLVVVPIAHEAVINNLDQPVVVLDVHNRVVSINPSALKLLRLQDGQVSGQPADQVFASWPELMRHLSQNGDQRGEVVLPLDEDQRPYHLRVTSVQNRDGSPIGRLVHLQDIAEHKQTEAALAQSEKSYYAIVEDMGDPYFEADRSGKITYANAAFSRHSGFPLEEIIGRNFRRFTGPDYVRTVWEYFAEAYSKGPPDQPLEYVFRRADGERRLAELMVSMIHVSDGRPVGTRGILRDITDRRQAELALQRAKEAAEEASQAKSAFLANVSHELRTPLTSVLGFAKIIRKRLHEQIFPRVDDRDLRTQRAMAKVSHNLDIIVTESERLTSLINDVLDLTKIEAGKEDWQMQPVSLATVIDQAASATAGLFDPKRLRLALDVDPGLPLVCGDRDRLMQVVINLLANAVKFTDRGSVTCQARQQRGQVVVNVSDTGIGIAPEDQGTVFELFTQVGDTLTDKPKGTGLGLPICKQIIEHHGGRIWVESVPGQGSTFAFALPAYIEAVSDAPAENAQAGQRPGAAGPAVAAEGSAAG